MHVQYSSDVKQKTLSLNQVAESTQLLFFQCIFWQFFFTNNDVGYFACLFLYNKNCYQKYVCQRCEGAGRN
jgi:hypothetical protein